MPKVLASVVVLIFSIQSTIVPAAENPQTTPSREELLARSNVQGALSALDAWIDGLLIYKPFIAILSIGIAPNIEQ